MIGIQECLKKISLCSNKDAIAQVEYYFTNINGVQKPIITTKVWDLQGQWTDGSTYWSPFTFIKESNTVLLSEYMESYGIGNEPAFKW